MEITPVIIFGWSLSYINCARPNAIVEASMARSIK
jgi:hypothetical protein